MLSSQVRRPFEAFGEAGQYIGSDNVQHNFEAHLEYGLL